jgi:uncharacterized protein Yka (UPF0111/DUF47 family)
MPRATADIRELEHEGDRLTRESDRSAQPHVRDAVRCDDAACQLASVLDDVCDHIDEAGQHRRHQVRQVPLKGAPAAAG